MKRQLIALCLIFIVSAGACKKDSNEKIDTEYPVIDISTADAFPKQCSVVKRGQKFNFKANLTDNAQLGSVSVDIHHNFDHHTHSTEVSDCGMDPIKTPVKPFLLIKDFSIPAGQTSYQVNAEINVPADIDPGDYHFLIRLTDKEGWQTIKGLSIKIQ
ncbi:DUF4625 domain-containing protein [Mucilaginibacter sp. Bleaf8]|uniref:DUF4625 domain-containing protein n=1 Tax=Mucilaginibacter sp. Bleaf8 TaxID=2834430 RepID=UPI001BD11EF9|nr:DUF4625 domain-containing protein [Mucilaginibacter sp. Bleaf8]MBS7563885.1 DUF4625 domain-containing protein [Mucilaginibacter sp. Bleaf8]